MKYTILTIITLFESARGKFFLAMGLISSLLAVSGCHTETITPQVSSATSKKEAARIQPITLLQRANRYTFAYKGLQLTKFEIEAGVMTGKYIITCQYGQDVYKPNRLKVDHDAGGGTQVFWIDLSYDAKGNVSEAKFDFNTLTTFRTIFQFIYDDSNRMIFFWSDESYNGVYQRSYFGDMSYTGNNLVKLGYYHTIKPKPADLSIIHTIDPASYTNALPINPFHMKGSLEKFLSFLCVQRPFAQAALDGSFTYLSDCNVYGRQVISNAQMKGKNQWENNIIGYKATYTTNEDGLVTGWESVKENVPDAVGGYSYSTYNLYLPF